MAPREARKHGDRSETPIGSGGVDQAAAALRGGLPGELLHAGLGLLVLLVIQVLNVYKPRGLTPYGWRTQQAMQPLGHRPAPYP